MRARFGDDGSIFLVDWQWAPDNAKPLPFPTAFASNHTDPEHTDGGQVGEVRQVFYPLARTFLPSFLTGDHQCGSQDFWQNGWPEDTPGIPLVGLVPTCCTFYVELVGEACSCAAPDTEPAFLSSVCSCSDPYTQLTVFWSYACSCSDPYTQLTVFWSFACSCSDPKSNVNAPMIAYPCSCSAPVAQSNYIVSDPCSCSDPTQAPNYHPANACSCSDPTQAPNYHPADSCACAAPERGPTVFSNAFSNAFIKA